MKCADPVLCYLDSKGNRKFRNFSFAIKQIGGIPNSHIVLDCGKCITCRKKRAYELAARCVLHASLQKDNCFLTLTYDEKRKDYHNEFEYSDIQKFKKRLRKHCEPTKIQIFNVHEYGKNGKKHWHLIIFNYIPEDRQKPIGSKYFTSKTLETLWPYGFHSIGDVNEASAMYQSQYMEKDFKNYNSHSTKKSHSKHSGLGRPYFEKHYKQILTLGYIPFNGKKLAIPRYFQKLARKHYAHYYDTSLFAATCLRKPLYRPFLPGQANKEIADLYSQYRNTRDNSISELKENWDQVISQFLTTNETPDFIKANQNHLHDLRNKIGKEQF